MEEQLRQWEKLEEESFLCWESETARRQQDIWFLWEMELRKKLEEVAEEWSQQCTMEQKKLEEILFLEWKGEAAQKYQKEMGKMYECSQNLAVQLQETVEEFGDSVQKCKKKL